MLRRGTSYSGLGAGPNKTAHRRHRTLLDNIGPLGDVTCEAGFWSHGRRSKPPTQAEYLACRDVSDDDRRGTHLSSLLQCDTISDRRVRLQYPYRARVAHLWLCQAHVQGWVVLTYYFLLDCCWSKQASQASDALIAAGPRNGGLMAIRRIILCGETQESRSRNKRRSQRSADTIMDFLAMIPRRPTSASADPCSGGKSAILLGLPH